MLISERTRCQRTSYRARDPFSLQRALRQQRSQQCQARQIRLRPKARQCQLRSSASQRICTKVWPHCVAVMGHAHCAMAAYGCTAGIALHFICRVHAALSTVRGGYETDYLGTAHTLMSQYEHQCNRKGPLRQHGASSPHTSGGRPPGVHAASQSAQFTASEGARTHTCALQGNAHFLILVLFALQLRSGAPLPSCSRAMRSPMTSGAGALRPSRRKIAPRAYRSFRV
jgi:hypothetical protein